MTVEVTAPTTGAHLPILLFSHGAGFSQYDYGGLAEAFAAAGFVVLRPTHLDSRTLNLSANDPRRTKIWFWRARDLSYLLDKEAAIEAAAPGLSGRIDRGRAVVVGHSYGGHTAAAVLGMRVIDPDNGDETDLSDLRIIAGVLLAPPGGVEG